MSGLALAVSRGGPGDESMVRRMLGAVPHRGGHVRIARRGSVALGVRSSVDDETASLASSNGLLAAISGTIDNAAEPGIGDLMASTETPSGAALLLAAYERWGESAVSRLRGSFAGVITDGWVVLAFRDHFGCRPLFHHEGRAGWLAATEVKQIVAGARLDPKPDLEHLERVLYGGVELSTAVAGVSRVPRGSLGRRVADGRAPTFRRYWDPREHVETVGRISLQDARDGLVDALDLATARMLRGNDVILLSGGLDSPAIAASAIRSPLGESVQALTSTYPQHPSVDERAWAEMIAAHLGLTLGTYVAEATSMDDLELWAERLDGPVDVLSIPECAEAYVQARARGGRTVLNGEVAEYLLDSRKALLGHLLYRRRWAALGHQMRLRRGRGLTRRRIAREIARDATPVGALLWYRDRRRREETRVPPWMDTERATAVLERGRIRPWDRWSELQTRAFFGSGLQLEADEITAAYCGVDSRRPFTDVDLWQFVLGLPAEIKHADLHPKQLLRDGMRGRLPDQHLDRRDKTFFDEFHLATADYAVLRKLLTLPEHRMPGIDYAMLQHRLEHGELAMAELRWARDLARIHAFLDGS